LVNPKFELELISRYVRDITSDFKTKLGKSRGIYRHGSLGGKSCGLLLLENCYFMRWRS